MSEAATQIVDAAVGAPEQTTTALTPLPRQIDSVLKNLTFSEDVVRAALNNAYQDAWQVAPDAVARALVKCARHGLDPLGDHVAVYQPQKGGAWAVYVTLKGYEHIASQHPDFGAITFTDFEERDGEIWIGAYAHRKSFRVPSGPFWGRCKKEGKKSQAKGGGTYKIEWPFEIAQARARRTALRVTFGLNLPDDDFNDEPSRWRDDQRRRLHVHANAQGWTREQRHFEAGKVLGRKVTTWSTLTEEDATRLEIAWDAVYFDDQANPSDVIDVAPAQALSQEAGGVTTQAEESEEPRGGQSRPTPNQEQGSHPHTETPSVPTGSASSEASSADPAAHRGVTPQQLDALRHQIRMMSWTQEDVLKLTNGEVPEDLTFSLAAKYIGEWAQMLVRSQNNRIARLTSAAVARGYSLNDIFTLMSIADEGELRTRYTVADLNGFIAQVEELPPHGGGNAGGQTDVTPDQPAGQEASREAAPAPAGQAAIGDDGWSDDAPTPGTHEAGEEHAASPASSPAEIENARALLMEQLNEFDERPFVQRAFLKQKIGDRGKERIDELTLPEVLQISEEVEGVLQARKGRARA